MKQHDDTEMLRRYIRESLIVEFEGGIDLGGYPMGIPFSGQLDPSSISKGFRGFGKAGSDVIDATKALGEKGLAGVARILKVGASGFLDILTGGALQADYNKIHDEYKNEIRQIESKYKDAIGSSWKALSENAPLAAIMGLPAAFTVKTIVENPRLAGAAAALAGGGPAASIVGKINSILGLPSAAATAATATIGAKAGEAASKNESKGYRQKYRIVLKEVKTKSLSDLSEKEQAELEELVAQLQQLVKKVVDEDVKKIESTTKEFADQLAVITDKLQSVKNEKLTPEQNEAAQNFTTQVRKDATMMQQFLGDKKSPLSSVIQGLPSFIKLPEKKSSEEETSVDKPR